LRFALIAAGVKPGDTVVTVPNTFIATTEAICQARARLDFVDVDGRTQTMDPERLRRYVDAGCTYDPQMQRLVSRRTGSPVTAIVPVHLYGQMADMDPILEIRTNTWHTAGSMGKAAAFSFYPGKNLGACGEAGAVTTDDEQLARQCRMLRDHGQSAKYHHNVLGYNGRLDAIQAGILRVKLRSLVKWNRQRVQRARAYDQLFASASDRVVRPHTPDWSRPVYHLYVVRVADRDRVQQELTTAGIGTGIHYPTPLHLCKAHGGLLFRSGDFPIAERAAREILSLPMFPGLTLESQRRVSAELVRAVSDIDDGESVILPNSGDPAHASNTAR
jgi:dTDP-4-amino-4,6-dideoxygalactose transaminase